MRPRRWLLAGGALLVAGSLATCAVTGTGGHDALEEALAQRERPARASQPASASNEAARSEVDVEPLRANTAAMGLPRAFTADEPEPGGLQLSRPFPRIEVTRFVSEATSRDARSPLAPDGTLAEWLVEAAPVLDAVARDLVQADGALPPPVHPASMQRRELHGALLAAAFAADSARDPARAEMLLRGADVLTRRAALESGIWQAEETAAAVRHLGSGDAPAWIARLDAWPRRRERLSAARAVIASHFDDMATWARAAPRDPLAAFAAVNLRDTWAALASGMDAAAAAAEVESLQRLDGALATLGPCDDLRHVLALSESVPGWTGLHADLSDLVRAEAHVAITRRVLVLDATPAGVEAPAPPCEHPIVVSTGERGTTVRWVGDASPQEPWRTPIPLTFTFVPGQRPAARLRP